MILSIGYPPTGQVTISLSPATAAMFGINLTEGGPKILILAECLIIETSFDAVQV